MGAAGDGELRVLEEKLSLNAIPPRVARGAEITARAVSERERWRESVGKYGIDDRKQF